MDLGKSFLAQEAFFMKKVFNLLKRDRDLMNIFQKEWAKKNLRWRIYNKGTHMCIPVGFARAFIKKNNYAVMRPMTGHRINVKFTEEDPRQEWKETKRYPEIKPRVLRMHTPSGTTSLYSAKLVCIRGVLSEAGILDKFRNRKEALILAEPKDSGSNFVLNIYGI